MMVYQRGGAGGGGGGTSALDVAARAVEARLRGWVERLAVPRHAWANPGANRRVCDELAGALSDAGYAVRLQGRFRNVVALPRGAAGRSLTLVAAHYDGVPGSPGADDNASGLAALLECARSLAGAGAVGFVAFNAEEDGQLGSREFVAEGLRELPGPVSAVHVLEMVGFRGPAGGAQRLPLPWAPRGLRSPDFIGLLTKGPSNEIVDRALDRAGPGRLRLAAAKTWGPLERLLPDLTRSDHLPFWLAGIAAALWTDTGDFRNPHYHRASDTPDTLDYGFLREVAALVGAVASGAAGAGPAGRLAPAGRLHRPRDRPALYVAAFAGGGGRPFPSSKASRARGSRAEGRAPRGAPRAPGAFSPAPFNAP